MCPKWMSNLQLYFDIFGFCTHFNGIRNQSTVYRIIFIIHVILATVSSLIILSFLRRPIPDKLGAFNDSLKLCLTPVVYWLSIFELYSKQQTQKKFWNIIQQIERKFHAHHKLRFKAYVLIISMYSIFYVLMYFNYLLRIFTDKKSVFMLFWSCFTFVGLFRTNQFFYYLLCMEFVKNELEMIKFDVDEILHNKVKNCSRTFDRHHFKSIRQFYDSIYDLKEIVNSVFGWSNVVAIIVSFQLLLAEINWFYWRIFNKFNSDVIGKYF